MNILKKNTDSAVIAAALSLMLGAAVQTILLFGGRVNYIPDFIRLSVVTIPAMLIPVLLIGKQKNTPVYSVHEKKLSPAKSILFIISGFAVCTALNFLFSLLRSLLSANNSASAAEGNDLTGFLLMLFSAGILPAILEEILFRGKILPLLTEGGKGFSVFISAVLFAFIHNGIFNIVFAFTAGLVLGFIRSETKRLVPCIIVHLLNNTLALLIMFFHSSLSKDLSDMFFYISGIAGIIISAAMLPFILKFCCKDCFILSREPFITLLRSPVFYVFILSAVIMQVL